LISKLNAQKKCVQVQKVRQKVPSDVITGKLEKSGNNLEEKWWDWNKSAIIRCIQVISKFLENLIVNRPKLNASE
jgi:hypothetical protein